VVVSFSSWAGSVSSLSFFSTSWIFVSTVVSSELSKIGLVASSSVWPSFTMTTRFWHLTHHISPLLSLNSGEAQAGHDNSVSVAPFFSKSTIDCNSFDSLVGNF